MGRSHRAPGRRERRRIRTDLERSSAGGGHCRARAASSAPWLVAALLVAAGCGDEDSPGATPTGAVTVTGTSQGGSGGTGSTGGGTTGQGGGGGAGTDYFGTLPAGAALPDDDTCTSLVRRSDWEPRRDNEVANHTTPTADELAFYATGSWSGQDPEADTTIRSRVTGDFVGTTDEIIQWGACKWGIDEDVIRAMAVKESGWHQDGRGDWTTDQQYCPPGTWEGDGCYQSYGMLQVKWRYSQETWPMSRDDTAFSLDYVYASMRSCLEGYIAWFDAAETAGYPDYAPGDLWGCVGRHYSGSWYDQGAIDYIAAVEEILADRPWEQSDF
ncbi:MAG: hypothetical protein JRI23_27315 [Deltaproteobacteria bacterium]|jgi:autotransporter family porin|nr:hypothetical protein [Deltaproteobacteria bacterium]MBW2535789.1 hypothetical protein [Deltaproteobacteria bacterium]